MSGRGVNLVVLVGHVGADPEVRESGDSAITVAKFSLCTNRVIVDRTGHKSDEPSWHRLVCFGELAAKVVRPHVKKGELLHIQGRISYQTYNDKLSGEEKRVTEIIVDELTLLGGKT